MIPAKPKPAQPLADLLEECLAPALRRRGFVSSDVLVNWEEIAGARLAARSEPLEIRWPRRPPQAAPDAPAEPATLIVRVEGAFALEFEYGTALLMERLNGHFGWRCIGRIIIKQGPVQVRQAAQRSVPVLDEAGRRRLAEMTEGIEPPLKAAVERLGEGVLGRPTPAR